MQPCLRPVRTSVILTLSGFTRFMGYARAARINYGDIEEADAPVLEDERWELRRLAADPDSDNSTDESDGDDEAENSGGGGGENNGGVRANDGGIEENDGN